jgi:hypothetical protein
MRTLFCIAIVAVALVINTWSVKPAVGATETNPSQTPITGEIAKADRVAMQKRPACQLKARAGSSMKRDVEFYP